MKNQTRNIFDHEEVAHRYQRTGGFGAERKERMYAVALDFLLTLAPPNSALLELGAGTGHFTAQIAAANHFSRIHVTDGAPAMLAIARKQLAQVNGRLTFDVIDFTTEWVDRLGGQLFTAVTSAMAIHHAADKQRVFQQVYDVLQPGNIFVLADHMTAVSPLARDLIARDRALLILGREDQPTADEIQAQIEINTQKSIREGNLCQGVTEYLAALAACGFVDVTCLWRDLWLAVFIARKPGAGQ